MAQVARPVRRRWFLIAIGVIVALIVLLSALSGFYVDLLWFREVTFSSVFWSVFWAKLVLGLIFGFAFFALLAANLFIVRRLTPRFRPFSPEQEMIERYRMALEPYLRWLIIAFSGLIAIFVGVQASAQWQPFLLWRNAGGVTFGANLADPVFSRDPSFYVFLLPFQRFVQGWLFAALVATSLITAIAHYLNGGIRLQTVGEKVTPQVKAHLSVLLGLIFLVKAWGYYLGRFDLLLSPRGVVTGASYTDIHVQKPALLILMVIAVVCAALFLVNIRFRGWILPVLAVGLLALTSIVAGAIVPAIVQRLSVDPQEFQREERYIKENIAATRAAFGLDRIQLTTTGVGEQVSQPQIAANQATISNVRLWDPDIVKVTNDTLQRFTQFYEFTDVDVDRYTIQGQKRVVMVSPREISQNGIPGQGKTWLNTHLVYTHGYGAVANLVNRVGPQGAPVYVLNDIPPEASRGIELDPGTGAQIYYAERDDVGFVLVGTQQAELDFPQGQGFQTTTYQGRGGIPLSGFFRRALFAYRFRDPNLLISGLIGSDTKIIINRDIRSRVQKAAPFLTYDGDPYAAVVGGRLVYIWDAYTTTDRYPYSERVTLTDVTLPRIGGRVNYIRNSVKAVVDAYDGTVKLYKVDPSDPLLRVWARAFPDLFAKEPAPEELVAHFRYPENLLQIQAAQFARYHQTEPQTFYNNGRLWAIPDDPKPGVPEGTKLRPYYVLLKLPGETDEEFVLFMPFTPAGTAGNKRTNMVAYLAAKSDPEHYGEVRGFEFTAGGNVTGPEQAFALINGDPTFAKERSLLDVEGSVLIFGNIFIVPIEDSFLYVQPIFVASQQQNSIPELKRVVLVNGQTERVYIGDTLEQAIAASVGAAPPPPPSGGGGEPSGDVAGLLQQALEHFQTADGLLRQGDLAGYQRELGLAQDLIEQANELSGGTPAASPSPSPGASPSP